VLGLDDHPFMGAAPVCSTFSKCVRKGSNVQLSGSEAYNQLIMPLMSAMHYFKTSAKTLQGSYYFDAHLVLGVAVLDAPMIAVHVNEQPNKTSFAPWVRILRHEPRVDTEFFAHIGDLFAIDVVHKDFFQAYLNQHIAPFAEQFRVLAHKHHEELATGKGFISGMGAESWENLEARLRPITSLPSPPPMRIPPRKKEKEKGKGKGKKSKAGPA
jgi:hypothetical protein